MSKNINLKGFNNIRLDIDKKFQEIIGEKIEFPKYTTQILNIANRNAQGTRPSVVGQMSELTQQPFIKDYESWKKWYLKNYPKAIDRATDKVEGMIDKMRDAMKKIDRPLIKKYIEDLVVNKSIEGLIIQEIILKELSIINNVDYKSSSSEEESKGIDGYLGDTPISIKPYTFLSKPPSVKDNIKSEIIYYKKTDNYLYIYSDKFIDSDFS